MSEARAFPYETRLNILYGPLEVVDEKALADACEFKWYNQTLCQVNGSVVRLGVFQGEYHWHMHDDDDEFFYVVEGKLLIDLEGRTVELAPRTGSWYRKA
jgi:Cupin domain